MCEKEKEKNFLNKTRHCQSYYYYYLKKNQKIQIFGKHITLDFRDTQNKRLSGMQVFFYFLCVMVLYT